jgi:alkylhydroperoxidase family enzyme
VVDPIDELRTAAASMPPAPAALGAYLEKVRDCAYTITDEDVDALKAAGFSEDELFEQTVAAAAAEGFRRLDAADRVLR